VKKFVVDNIGPRYAAQSRDATLNTDISILLIIAAIFIYFGNKFKIGIWQDLFKTVWLKLGLHNLLQLGCAVKRC
jgi:hypothetical protein